MPLDSSAGAIYIPHTMTIPSRLPLLERVLERDSDFSPVNASISCRVWALGVALSKPKITGAMSVEIGGGEPGLLDMS